MSSDVFPWMSEYEFRELPDYDEICYLLDDAGEYATLNNHRLTFHPGPFNVLGSPNDKVVDKTIKELNQHSQMMDLMGFFPSHYNKINIHVGGTYGGDFEGTASRWVKNFYRLDENTRSRLTLENDDKASMWSVKRLYELIYQRVGVPIVFDYHHFRFCTGDQTQEEAIQMAASTWPAGIRPVVHLSESRREEQGDEKIRAQAHSDWIYNPVPRHGVQYDMMLECKMKEQALIRYRKILQE